MNGTQVSQTYRIVMARAWFKYPVAGYVERTDVAVCEKRLVLIGLDFNQGGTNDRNTVFQDILMRQLNLLGLRHNSNKIHH